MAKKKVEKVYAVTCHRDRGNGITLTGTLQELIKSYSYTLECGRSWQHERGNKKINCNPKTIAGLITNLGNAVNNSAANGYAGKYYTYKEVEAVVTTITEEKVTE